MANLEAARHAKRLGRLLIKCGLILFACGAGVILLALAAVRYGTYNYASWPHMVILLGVTVMLYLGFLPALVGAALWIAGRVKERSALSPRKPR
jgi:uncharacterized protein (DUF983 family)